MSPRNKTTSGDPLALRSPALCRFFAGVMQRQMRAAFRAVRLARPRLPDFAADRPVIVYSNHPSWWDPAFFIVLSDALFPDRESFGPMDVTMIERYRFMRRIGIFGVEQDGGRGAAAFLRTSERILQDPRRMLWITSQGRFSDPRTRPLELRGGTARLMSRIPDLVALPLALEYPFWTEKRPEALALFGEPVRAREGESVDALNARLALELTRGLDDLADRSIRRDTGAFDLLITGTSGVGGMYGGWSRVRAAITRHRHVREHMEET